MKHAASLLGFVLLSVSAMGVLAQAPQPSAVITINRTSKGCDITLPKAIAKTLTDRLYLVIDGSSEGFGGESYSPDFDLPTLHYTATVSNDLDDQVKAILKAQNVPVKDSVTTYHITCGLNVPSNISVSKSLSFRHESNIISYTHLPYQDTYKVGDKIPLFEAVAVDSSVEMSGILGQSVEKQNQQPHDLLHRITIQVQFVPKAKEGADSPGIDRKKGQG